MKQKSLARAHILQFLYSVEFSHNLKEIDDKLIREYWKNFKWGKKSFLFAKEIIKGLFKNQLEIDNLIDRVLYGWKLERLDLLEKNILRLAVYELLREKKTPPPVIINEAIELAKGFCNVKSKNFINGVLDTILGQLPKGEKE